MRMIEMFTVNLDRIVKPGKGMVTAGGGAGITIFDTDRAWTFDINKSQAKSRNSPFRGGHAATIVNGRFVWRLT